LIGKEPTEWGSPMMEELLVEKYEFVVKVVDDDLRDLDAISIGMIYGRLEITLLDWLILRARQLDLPDGVVQQFTENRDDA
jgi:hypothetical protein